MVCTVRTEAIMSCCHGRVPGDTGVVVLPTRGSGCAPADVASGHG